MPDFDVQALSLATPPAPAPVATYRPAVRVRNNGTGPASVTGYLRVYRREPPGDLLASFTLSLNSLAAGQEGTAQADGYWTPTEADIGREFLFTGYVTTENDQVEPNNNLAPVTVIVTGEEPPPPPVVTAHATQHESGGSDQISVDGLSGELAEEQAPKDHAAKHQQGGTDQISVAGLSGQLADAQLAAAHGNERHLETFLEASALAAHETDDAPHSAATNLQFVSEKGQANGYAGLDGSGFVDITDLPTWSGGTARTQALVQGDDGSDPTLSRGDHNHPSCGGFNAHQAVNILGVTTQLMSHAYPANYFSLPGYHAFRFKLWLTGTAAAGNVVNVIVWCTSLGSPAMQLCNASITLPSGINPACVMFLEIECVIQGGTNTATTSAWRSRWLTTTPSSSGGTMGVGGAGSFPGQPSGTISVAATWSGAGAMAAVQGVHEVIAMRVLQMS